MKSSNDGQTSRAWRSCRVAALLLAIATFTPAVIPMDTDSPRLFGLPVTLWAGGLVSLAYLALTIVAVRVRPGRSGESRCASSEGAAGRVAMETE